MSTKNLTDRPYQEKLDRDIVNAWDSGAQNVMATLPTGGGKTHLFSGIIAREPGYTCAIAHRQELVGQMSLSLNKRCVPHFAHVPDDVVKWIVSQHMQEHGVSYYTTNARCAVAGVRTLNARRERLKGWCERVDLFVMDEGHHVTRDNEWGKATELFTNARGLLVTATAFRADGKGLGRHAHGVVDEMVHGPSPRELINLGYLTDYRIFAPPCDINLTDEDISKTTGDFVKNKMVSKVRESHIVGDVVEHYLKLAPGKLGITFVPSVDIAVDTSASFNAAGVPCEVVSAKTPKEIRTEAIRRFRRGDLKQLVNVDIFGEGFDLPALEVVSFARPTASLVMYRQQFGRVLRTMVEMGKTHGLVIDHVGNVMRHGLPDAHREWTLDARERRNERDPDMIPLKTCPACTGVYEAFYKKCPYQREPGCADDIVPANRSDPKFVDGDLTELDLETLMRMRGEIDRIDTPVDVIKNRLLHSNMPNIAAMGATKNHRLRQGAQGTLRNIMSVWAGYQRQHENRDDSETYKRFYWKFGIDMMSAQALGRPEAEELAGRVSMDLWR